MAEDHVSGPQFFPKYKPSPAPYHIKFPFYLKMNPYINIPLTCNFSHPVIHSAKNALTYTTVDNTSTCYKMFC